MTRAKYEVSIGLQILGGFFPLWGGGGRGKFLARRKEAPLILRSRENPAGGTVEHAFLWSNPYK